MVHHENRYILSTFECKPAAWLVVAVAFFLFFIRLVVYFSLFGSATELLYLLRCDRLSKRFLIKKREYGEKKKKKNKDLMRHFTNVRESGNLFCVFL